MRPGPPGGPAAPVPEDSMGGIRLVRGAMHRACTALVGNISMGSNSVHYKSLPALMANKGQPCYLQLDPSVVGRCRQLVEQLP